MNLRGCIFFSGNIEMRQLSRKTRRRHDYRLRFLIDYEPGMYIFRAIEILNFV